MKAIKKEKIILILSKKEAIWLKNHMQHGRTSEDASEYKIRHIFFDVMKEILE